MCPRDLNEDQEQKMWISMKKGTVASDRQADATASERKHGHNELDFQARPKYKRPHQMST
jgi:hypothetical protein